jgi:hypothetical protein
MIEIALNEKMYVYKSKINKYKHQQFSQTQLHNFEHNFYTSQTSKTAIYLNQLNKHLYKSLYIIFVFLKSVYAFKATKIK